MDLVALISLLLRLFLVYLFWMHCWTFPLAFLVLQIPQVPDDFLAIVQVNFRLVFFCNRPGNGRFAGLPLGFSVGLLMSQRREVLILIGTELQAIALIGISSIGKGMFELLDLFLSFDLVVTDLLVQHVSIQLLLAEFFSADVLVFTERIHFIVINKNKWRSSAAAKHVAD